MWSSLLEEEDEEQLDAQGWMLLMLLLLLWSEGWAARGTSVMDGVGEVPPSLVRVIGCISVLSEMLTSTWVVTVP